MKTVALVGGVLCLGVIIGGIAMAYYIGRGVFQNF